MIKKEKHVCRIFSVNHDKFETKEAADIHETSIAGNKRAVSRACNRTGIRLMLTIKSRPH